MISGEWRCVRFGRDMDVCVVDMFGGAGLAEEAIWIQLLIVVILAAGWGVYVAVRTQRRGFAHGDGAHRMEMGNKFERLRKNVRRQVRGWADGVAEKAKEAIAGVELPRVAPAEKQKPTPSARKVVGGRRDVSSGMELLPSGFVVGVVEDLSGEDEGDVTMRRCCFEELARRGELSVVDSGALMEYAEDLEGRYSKEIQCEAMKELARRTMDKSSSRRADAVEVAGTG